MVRGINQPRPTRLFDKMRPALGMRKVERERQRTSGNVIPILIVLLAIVLFWYVMAVVMNGRRGRTR